MKSPLLISPVYSDPQVCLRTLLSLWWDYYKLIFWNERNANISQQVIEEGPNFQHLNDKW